MSIHFNIEGESAHQVLEEMRTLMTALTGAAPVPQKLSHSDILKATSVEIVEEEQIPRDPPKTRKSKKDKEPETIEGTTNPLSNASTADSKPSASTSSEQDNSSTSASDAPSVPELDDVRAKLKTLGATDGLGHDKVFEVLGKYGAKNASTVPEDKRAALIAEIDELLKGAK